METFMLVIMIFVSPVQMTRITSPFDTKVDCERASQLLQMQDSGMGRIYSIECFTVDAEPEGDPIKYGTGIEQGV